MTLLGPPERCREIIRAFDVERVVIAFSNESHEDTLELIHALREFDIQLDLVPRLFEIVGPRVGVHTVEGLPLIGLPPTRWRRSSRLIKRAIDIVGASLMLLLTRAAVRRSSRGACAATRPGPVFFRQKRLGLDMQRVHRLQVPHDARGHRRQRAPRLHQGDDGPRHVGAPQANGLYKLERPDAITKSGHWLRKTEPRRAAAADQRAQRRHVARRPAAVPGLRDRAASSRSTSSASSCPPA